MIASHAGLRELADDIGVPPQSYGDACPIGEARLKSASTQLHVVA
jgi:hypothetical protein